MIYRNRSNEVLQLEQQQFALRQYIEENLLLDVDAQFYRDSFHHAVVAEFRTAIWSHKLPPETKVETTEVEVKEWKSAWQLWKHNHWHAWWFTYLGFLWLCKPPEQVNKTITATCSFDLSRNVLFPEFRYPDRLGARTLRVDVSEPVWEWAHEV